MNAGVSSGQSRPLQEFTHIAKLIHAGYTQIRVVLVDKVISTPMRILTTLTTLTTLTALTVLTTFSRQGH